MEHGTNEGTLLGLGNITNGPLLSLPTLLQSSLGVQRVGGKFYLFFCKEFQAKNGCLNPAHLTYTCHIEHSHKPFTNKDQS